MRKYSFLYILAVAVSFMLVSCEAKKVLPAIFTEVDSLEIGPEGGTYSIAYEIYPEEEGGSLTATCPAPYISKPDCTQSGVISFTAAVNGKETRSTEITITYTWNGGSTSTKVAVIQEGGIPDNPETGEDFTLNVSEVTHSSAQCSVDPSDDSIEHIAMVIVRDKYDGYTDEEWFAADLAYFASISSMLGMDLKDYLYNYRIHTGDLDFTATGLDPDTDYLLYAYGINYAGDYPAITTSVSKLPFRTTAPEVVEDEIVLEVEIFDSECTIVATPWSDDLLYYVDWMSEKILTQGGITEGTLEERLFQWTYDWMSEYLAFGFTAESLGWYGPKSVSFTITDPADTYYAFAYVLNEDATMGSRMFIRTITNGTDVTSTVAPIVAPTASR